MRVLTLAALLAMASLAAGKNLPEKFFGSFSLDRQMNVEEYLENSGIDSWITRVNIKLRRVSISFTKASPDSFNMEIFRGNDHFIYKDIFLDQVFIGEGFATKDKISFSVYGEVVWEWHFPIDNAHIKNDMFQFYFEGEELVEELSYPHGSAKRYFKRD